VDYGCWKYVCLEPYPGGEREREPKPEEKVTVGMIIIVMCKLLFQVTTAASWSKCTYRLQRVVVRRMREGPGRGPGV
jgi:hypothetical protein